MIIETKFNTGDIIWVFHEGEPLERMVYGVRIRKFKISERPIIDYQLNGIDGDFNESELFKSKADLLNSL